MKDMKTRFEEKNGGVVQLKGGDGQGINTFFTLLECLFLGAAGRESSNYSQVVLEFGPQTGLYSMIDVLDHIYAELELKPETDDPGWTDTAIDPFEAVYSAVDDEHFVMIVFKHLNRAEQSIQNSIRKHLTADSREGNKRVIFFLGVEETIPGANFATYHLPDQYEENDFLEYFLNKGFDQSGAAKNAQILIQYQDKGHPADKIIELAEIFDRASKNQ
jgi:hypothetical protein